MVLGTISDNMAQTIILCPLFGQTPSRNSVVMATPKVPGDKKLFVSYVNTKGDKVPASYT